MCVTTLLKESVVRRNAEGLEDCVRGDHTSVVTERAQPDVVGVFETEEGTGRNEGSEKMVVEGKDVERVDVLVEEGRKPNVLCDDFCRSLHNGALVLLVERQPPARVTSRARFLCDSEGDTGLEGASGKSSLSVTRATGDGDFSGVDVSGGSDFEHVDNAGNTPCPSDHGRGVVVRAVEVVEETLAAAARVIFLGDVIVIVVQKCNLYGFVK